MFTLYFPSLLRVGKNSEGAEFDMGDLTRSKCGLVFSSLFLSIARSFHSCMAMYRILLPVRKPSVRLIPWSMMLHLRSTGAGECL